MKHVINILKITGATAVIGSVPSGTWRCMGQTTAGGGYTTVTLFLRIS